MTPRARIKKSLAREPVDRMPNGSRRCETVGLYNLGYGKSSILHEFMKYGNGNWPAGPHACRHDHDPA